MNIYCLWSQIRLLWKQLFGDFEMANGSYYLMLSQNVDVVSLLEVYAVSSLGATTRESFEIEVFIINTIIIIC